MKIIFKGKFFDNHSLSIVNRNIALALQSIPDVDLYLCNTGPISFMLKELLVLTTKTSNEYDIELRHMYPPTWEWPENDKTRIIYIQPWEFYKVPLEWQSKFETFCDHVIVPSQWNKTLYTRSGLNPNRVTVIPNGCNPSAYFPGPKSQSNIKQFLYCGSHQYRKGLDILLQAWPLAFQHNKNVRLIIKLNPKIYGNSDTFQKISDLANVQLIDNDVEFKEMLKLYQTSDILVHPHRGEAYGMHIAEALRCNLRVIVPDCGPTDEYVGNEHLRIKTNTKIINVHDPKYFVGKPGDSYTLMGSHCLVKEPSVESLVEMLLLAVQTKNHISDTSRIQDWNQVGYSYYTLFKGILKQKHIVRNGQNI